MGEIMPEILMLWMSAILDFSGRAGFQVAHSLKASEKGCPASVPSRLPSCPANRGQVPGDSTALPCPARPLGPDSRALSGRSVPNASTAGRGAGEVGVHGAGLVSRPGVRVAWQRPI